MYSKSCYIYDSLYHSRGKDYHRECDIVIKHVERHKVSAGNRLLDVACGTGNHLYHLKESFVVEGIDSSKDMIAIARQRNPNVPIFFASMIDFNLGKVYDVVTCLFSSIGFVKTHANLLKAVQSMTNHLANGGVLLLEPWLFPEAIKPGVLHATFVDENDLKVARMSVVKIRGRDWLETDYFLVLTKEGVRCFREKLHMGIFDMEQYQKAMQMAGLTVQFDPSGLTGRGLFIGVKQSP